MAKPRAQLAKDVSRLAAELDRIGLLLHHDPTLPSATSLIAGEPIRGSWWGHAQGHRIYDALGAFDEQGGALSPKLVNGKLTYVARRLWPEFLALREAYVKGPLDLPAGTDSLLKELGSDPLRVDRFNPADFGGSKALTACVKAIGENFLAHVSSIHTESGKHVTVLSSWRRWARDHRVKRKAALGPAKQRLAAALDELQKGEKRARTPFDALLGR